MDGWKIASVSYSTLENIQSNPSLFSRLFQFLFQAFPGSLAAPELCVPGWWRMFGFGKDVGQKASLPEPAALAVNTDLHFLVPPSLCQSEDSLQSAQGIKPSTLARLPCSCAGVAAWHQSVWACPVTPWPPLWCSAISGMFSTCRRWFTPCSNHGNHIRGSSA